MKRILSLTLVSLILMLSLCQVVLTVSAKEEPWVLSADAMYITHGDKVYEYLDCSSYYYYQILYDKGYYGEDVVSSYEQIDLDFDDYETKRKFRGSYIYTENEKYLDTIFSVELYYEGAYVEDSIYVEQSKLDKYKKIVSGDSDTYYTNNDWDMGEGVTITAEKLDSIKESGKTTMSGMELKSMDSYYTFYATDPDTAFCISAGTVYWDKYEDDTMYLLLFGKYIPEYTYDGYLDLNIRKDYTVYAINDEDLRLQLKAAYETRPTDELDWVAPDDEVSIPWAMIFCSVIFGVFSLLVIAFAIVMLIVVKDKKYHRNFVVMLIGAAVVLIAYLVILLLLI